MRAPPVQSGAATIIRAVIGFVLLILAHFAVRPLFNGRVGVDFLIIAILFASVRLRPGFAALLGMMAGLAIDAMTPATFGAGMIAMTAVAAGASWARAVFFADNVALTVAFIFAGKWLLDIAATLFGGGVRGVDLAVQLLVWSPLSAALTTSVALLWLAIFRPLYRPQGA